MIKRKTKETIQYFDCVEIAIDSTHTYYLTQAPFNLTLTDGNTYIAAGARNKFQLEGAMRVPLCATHILRTQSRRAYPGAANTTQRLYAKTQPSTSLCTTVRLVTAGMLYVCRVSTSMAGG